MNSQKLLETMKKKFNNMKDQYSFDNEYIPKSISYTKLELPIHYSNLVFIEDMQIENSTYFITANGFVSKGLNLSSPKHDKNFHMSHSIFRIYPKTYNVNKDKVMEYINNQSKSVGEELKELHFKFSAEMFNNLDIIQNKFGEPVRYGDIIMLLHEHSRMFVEFVPSSKTLRLSNHDSEATLFSVEPAKEIMLNDNQILKTGQPIKLKIAWFSYGDKNLFFGLRFPYKKNNNISQPVDNILNEENNQDVDIQIVDNDDDSSNDNMFTIKYEGNLFNEKTKQYHRQPEIIVEENTEMKWRFSLFSTFTTNENLIVYGDLVQIFHCNTSSVLSIDIADTKIFDQQSVEYKILNLNNNQNDESISNLHQSHTNIELIESSENEQETILNLLDHSISQIDNDEDFTKFNFSTSSNFKLINHSMFSYFQDVNSTWVLVNLFPSKKNQSFIRYYEEHKLDTYQMIFRIKNFKTNQILTIQQCQYNNEDHLTGTKRGKQIEGYIEGDGENKGITYKFVLIDDITKNNQPTDESDISSEEYQYSLFGFTKSMKSSSYYSSRPEKNDFLYIYHIVSKSYLRIIPTLEGKCVLSLVKHPDECEVYKILPIDSKLQWEYRFLNNLMNLFNYVISNLTKINESKNIQSSKSLITKMLTITNFALDNLVKYLTNLYIDKFVHDAAYNSVVKSRQNLISNFGFTNIFLRNFIYNYWISNNMEQLKKLNQILLIQQSKRYYNTGHSNNITLGMYSYTKSIFDFLILYCKDNEEIKDELYSNLDIYFYFVNIIDSCLYGMIEIFNHNEKKLISLIRDCNQNEKFKSTLYTLSALYFPKHERSPNYNLIDLLFDFIEISKYEEEIKNMKNKDTNLKSKGISLLTREKYFELLKALVSNHTTNILENQREIINKIITRKKDNSDAYVFKEFIFNKVNKGSLYNESNELRSSLKELLFSIADKNPDDTINLFVQNHEQFTVDRLFPNEKKKIDDDLLAANIKWIIFFFPSSELLSAIIDPDETKKRQIFAEKVKIFYYEVIKQLEKMEYSIDFTNRSQVNLINSFLRLLKIIFEKNTVIDVSYLSYSNISGILLSYLTRKSQLIQANDTLNISHLIHGEMNEKKIILKHRITKSEHSQYCSIAESWLNAYLVFKFFLLKRIEETNVVKSKSIIKHEIRKSYDYGNVAMNSENRDLLMNVNNFLKEDEDFKNSNNQEKMKNVNKSDNTFYTKDDLIETTSNHNNKFINKTRTFVDDTSKQRTSTPDNFQSKTRSLFAEIHNNTNLKRDLSEDEKQKNMDEISINIINILKLSVKQNVAILFENFYHYYNSIIYRKEEKFQLDDFILHCVPNLDSGSDQINSFIQKFTENKLKSDAKCFSQLTNLNSVFEERIDVNLNFIQNLIKVFNLSEDIVIQESILDLIYVFFNQRRKFFNKVAMFNEHLSDFSNIKYNPFNNKEKIKSHFKKFYYLYEKNKQEYEAKTIDSFFTFLLNQLLHIYKKILKYWKNEFRILSLAYANKYYQNLESNELMIIKIEKILKLLLDQKSKIDQNIFSNEIYLEFIEAFFSIVYFMRKNADHSLFNSLITILNENGGIYNKMFFTLINDFINKGKQLCTWYINRQFTFFKKVNNEMIPMQNYSKEEIGSMKNKYYSALVMLITLQMVSLSRNDKTLKFLQDILLNHKLLLKYDSFSSFLILLSISDIQKVALRMNYFSIMEQIYDLNKNNCKENSISPDGSFPNSFSQLYIDIMMNVLQFIIVNNSIINEANLDEIVVDNFIFLIKKVSFNKFTKSQLKINYMKLVNYFHEIDSLNKIYLTKIRQESDANKIEDSINNFFLPPLEIYPMFKKYFDGIIFDGCIMQKNNKRKSFKQKDWNKKQLYYVKSCFISYKYLLFYFLEIDPKYFESLELLGNKREPSEWLKRMIMTVVNGHERYNNLNKNDDMEYDDLFHHQDNRHQENMNLFYESSFFYLLHCYSFKTIERNRNYISKNKELFKNEGIDLSKLEPQTFNKLKNYSNDSINDDSIDNCGEEHFIREKELFYSTGSNEDVCLFIFNKLKKYDDNKDNKQKYKQLFDNFKIKTKKDKKDKLTAFKSMLWKKSDELYQYADNETGSIVFYLLVLIDSETKLLYDEIFLTFINKIVEYISVGFSKAITHKRVKLTCFLLFIISEILRFYEENEEILITYTIRKKTLREVQVMFLKTGIIEKCLSLICKYNTPEIYDLFPYIFEMFCKLLKKGNYNSQEAFFALFTTKNKFEPVFSFMFEIMNKQINDILSNKANIIRKRKKQLPYEKKLSLKSYFDTKLDTRILQFLQLLCENHNRKLQLYLHHQENFRKCYDLVSQTQNYLAIILSYFEPVLFESLTKCFDLLIEFIQGPCLENQIALINSKILITLNDILQCYINCEKEELNKKFPERCKKNDKRESKEKDNLCYQPGLMKMSTQQISLLTFKTSILLLALVENRTKEDNIYLTIKGVVKQETIKEVYNKIFFEHLMILSNTNDLDDYSVKLNQFNRVEDVEDAAKSGKVKVDESLREPTDANDYLILETGFFMYFLNLYYEDYEINKEQIQRKESEKPLIQRFQNSCSGTIYDLVESFYFFIYDFSLSILKTITCIISGCLYAGSFGKVKIFNLMRRAFKHQEYDESHCLKFYQKYTQSIEILRDEVVYRIYFYLLPYCTSLNKFEKIRFLEEIDRTNTQTKLTEILKFADRKKHELEFDYKVKEYSSFIPLFGTLFKSIELWKDLSLLLNIAQNFFNIFAVYKVNITYTLCFTPEDCVQIAIWSDEKSFFGLTKEDFFDVLRSLSFFQCSLAALIFVEFISRKAPAIHKDAKEKVNLKNISQYKIKRNMQILFYFLKGFIINFEVLYYFCYVSFAFLGTFTSDFFFALLLLEIIQRFKTLRNVLKAIRNPYKQLFFTFTLWIILIYYFALIGYAFFRNNFQNQKDCSSLVRCVSTIFYENNKMDNGIGGYLTSIYELDRRKNPFIGRFWYDELFNLLLKILVIQMISGIIIDNFALLRVQEMDMLSDMENVCTICGLKKEEIEKVYTKYGKTYQDHLAVDHRLFNYIFYMIYLYQKDKTEFTGVESYIYELAYNQKDITWFPIDK